MEISLSPGRLMGAFNAGVADEAWGDLPMPMLSNPRVRFWFTERGWRAYGLRVAAGARTSTYQAMPEPEVGSPGVAVSLSS